jgi:hypothetical protein
VTLANDVETAVVLLVVGLAVGEIAARGRWQQAVAFEMRSELHRLQGVSELVALGEDADFVVVAAAGELTRLLHLADCRFETTWDPQRIRPTVTRRGVVTWGPTVWDSRRFGLPSDGAVLPVWGNGRPLGRFFLVPTVGISIGEDQLIAAIGLADQVGAALAASAAPV